MTNSLTTDVMEADVAAFQKILDTIEEAMTVSNTLKMQYKDASGNVSSREVEPMEIKSDGSLMAWCQKRDNVRRFKFANIISIKKTETSFTPREFDND